MECKAITINGQSLPVREYQGQRVVTIKDISDVHNVPVKNIQLNFTRNRKHFLLGTDYFELRGKKAVNNMLVASNITNINVFTESGYLMLAKSLTDDLSWSVQRALINSYFRFIQPKPDPERLDIDFSERALPVREFHGVRVITIKNMSGLFKVNKEAVKLWFKKHYDHMIPGVDYYEVDRKEQAELNIKRGDPIVYVITKTGFMIMTKHLTDAYSLEIQRHLLNNYFLDSVKSEKIYKMYMKLLPVKQRKILHYAKIGLSIRDISLLTGLNRGFVQTALNDAVKFGFIKPKKERCDKRMLV